MESPTKIVWYARGGGIQRMGPFPTHVEAARHLTTTLGDFPPNSFIWPEEAPGEPEVIPEDRARLAKEESEYEPLNAEGAVLIALERARQRYEEGYTAAHDDAHSVGDLLAAAHCYLDPSEHWHDGMSGRWPWDRDSWKPSKDPIRNLVKAGALIAAEIDRLLREKAREEK